MSLLRVYPSDTDPSTHAEWSTLGEITAHMPRGVRFERWAAHPPLGAGAGQQAILAAYEEHVSALREASGLLEAELLHVRPETPNHPALRRELLSEHVRAEDEARLFVEGSALVTLHHEGAVYCVLCEAGDLLHVPAGTPRWIDIGPSPRFTCLRFFTGPAGAGGSVARPTASDIADRFPRLGESGLLP